MIKHKSEKINNIINTRQVRFRIFHTTRSRWCLLMVGGENEKKIATASVYYNRRSAWWRAQVVLSKFSNAGGRNDVRPNRAERYYHAHSSKRHTEHIFFFFSSCPPFGWLILFRFFVSRYCCGVWRYNLYIYLSTCLFTYPSIYLSKV